MTPQQNEKQILKVLQRILEKSPHQTVLLVDGDRTLSANDTGRIFFETNQLDFQAIKTVFQKEGYGFSAFYNVAKEYSRIPKKQYLQFCSRAVQSVQIYSEWISFINTVQAHVCIIVVTSGIRQVWRYLLDKFCLQELPLIGGNYFPTDQYVVDQVVKGRLVHLAKKMGKTVYAFGDSLIDLEMLKQADHAIMVVNERQNWDLIDEIGDIKNFRQITFMFDSHREMKLTDFVELKSEILNL